MLAAGARAHTLLRAVAAFSALIAFSPPPVFALDAPQLVMLVRHAEKAAAPKGDVALSDAGLLRAESLAAALADARVDAIVTTQFRRTRETAAPLARNRHLTPVVVPTADNVEAHARAVAEAVRRLGPVVLVVGHSDTIPAIIHALGGPKLPPLCDVQVRTTLHAVDDGTGAASARSLDLWRARSAGAVRLLRHDDDALNAGERVTEVQQ